jgi:hypothetical protein
MRMHTGLTKCTPDCSRNEHRTAETRCTADPCRNAAKDRNSRGTSCRPTTTNTTAGYFGTRAAREVSKTVCKTCRATETTTQNASGSQVAGEVRPAEPEDVHDDPHADAAHERMCRWKYNAAEEV